MKKIVLSSLVLVIIFSFNGCQKLASDAQKSIDEASQQAQNVKNQVETTKATIDKKVDQVKELQQDIKNLTE